jgi:hypothetical protein
MAEFIVFYLSDTVTVGFNPTQSMVICFHIFTVYVVCVIHCRNNPRQGMTPIQGVLPSILSAHLDMQKMGVLGLH